MSNLAKNLEKAVRNGIVGNMSCPLPQALACDTEYGDCVSKLEVTVVTMNHNDPGEEPGIFKFRIPSCTARDYDSAVRFLTSIAASVSAGPITWQGAMAVLVANRDILRRYGIEMEQDDPNYMIVRGMDEDVE